MLECSKECEVLVEKAARRVLQNPDDKVASMLAMFSRTQHRDPIHPSYLRN